MLNPRLLTEAIVSTLQSNPDLTDLINPANIDSFHFNDRNLVERVAMMTSPGILVYWESSNGGNFSGYEIFKHRFSIVIRAQSMSHSSFEHVWRAIMNGPVNGTALNIRSLSIVPDVDLIDTPTVAHNTDGENSDYFVGTFVLPEIGDTPTPAIPTFTYYVNPHTGKDSKTGTSRPQAWLTTAPADAVTLTGSQNVGYFYYGVWTLYRDIGMTVDMATLPANLVTAGADTF